MRCAANAMQSLTQAGPCNRRPEPVPDTGSCISAVLICGTAKRASCLSVVPPRSYLHYLCAYAADTASMTRAIPTAYSGYQPSAHTNTRDSLCEVLQIPQIAAKLRVVLRCTVPMSAEEVPAGCRRCQSQATLTHATHATHASTWGTAPISSGTGIQWVPYVSHRCQAKRQGGAHGHAQAQRDARA